jgi:hypothetical protein
MKDGTTTYYCMCLAGTASALTEKKFKILRKAPNAFGDNTISHGFFMDGGKMRGGFKYELAATNVALLATYTYL